MSTSGLRRGVVVAAGAMLAGAMALSGASLAVAAAPTAVAHPAPVAVRAAEPTGKVVSRVNLSIREQPTTNSKFLGSLRPATVIALHCKKVGQNVDGNNLWYLLGGGKPGYVSARYVKNLAAVPYCR
ncbi:SH3 domain-containing protein [Streptantibioticus rubrisoli]|uniref:SH3 domain-containing protein n=1 Tax=Streptantibioticus rubrisoli TaxID=1387313 RepID=A0ABT1P5Y6_9ACTN|nr:SH3 domain-containing protein [Streptantibioticus rubrisoli]MCQ4040781.1 SH3 domain-containing protein [Streptantibioticus rubrisoli]